MTNFVIIALLLAGASDSSGLSFQAQLGYVPSLLLIGDDYSDYEGFIPPADEFLYLSHALYGKAGVGTSSGWQIRALGSMSYCAIPFGNSNIEFPLDSAWLHSNTSWSSYEFTLGGEIGYLLGFGRTKGSIYFGLEGVWGKLSGESRFYRVGASQTVHITSTMLGLQGHLGMNIPLFSFNRFNLGLRPMLKGGAVKEKSSDIPEDAEWLGPYTLSKWGIALGLTLNYNGGKQQ